MSDVYTFIVWCNIHTTPKRKPCTHPPPPPRQVPGDPTHLLSVFLDFPLLGISYKWNRMHGFKAHPCGSVEQRLLPSDGWLSLDVLGFVDPLLS